MKMEILPWPQREKGKALGTWLNVGAGRFWLQLLVSLSVESLKLWYTCDLLYSFGHGHSNRNVLSSLQPRNPSPVSYALTLHQAIYV